MATSELITLQHQRIYSCATCRLHISTHDQLVSKVVVLLLPSCTDAHCALRHTPRRPRRASMAVTDGRICSRQRESSTPLSHSCLDQLDLFHAFPHATMLFTTRPSTSSAMHSPSTWVWVLKLAPPEQEGIADLSCEAL